MELWAEQRGSERNIFFWKKTKYLHIFSEEEVFHQAFKKRRTSQEVQTTNIHITLSLLSFVRIQYSFNNQIQFGVQLQQVE